ncbi:MAG: selenocysteine-specific translation elongation factor, partial [Candidatus Dadabacteria bacterium]
EERARGISIELGFAYLMLPNGARVGIVDVPGHERFIRQMLAGAHGFDLVLLVVAADDGVMPQTEEHFEICHLLGVRRAVFAITKTDLVEQARVQEVREEIEILAAGTPFASAPVVAVSATRGDGIEDLRSLLIEQLAGVERPASSGPFRLPIDRAFVIKGHGVVVTGTAAGGRVRPGDELVLVPGSKKVRVREVQVHERPVEEACAGQRVALNLAGVERSEIRRGHCLVEPGIPAETSRFDAEVEVRRSARKEVASHQRVRVYLGTSERMGRIVWVDGTKALAPPATGYAQIVLAEPLVAFCGDRFVLRDETASRTLGGGRVLVARAPRRRPDPALAAELAALAGGDGPSRIAAFVRAQESIGVDPAVVACELGIAQEEAVELARRAPELVLLPSSENPALIAAAARYQSWAEQIERAVAAYHERVPSSPGMEVERLTAGRHRSEEVRVLLDGLVAKGRLVLRAGRVALPGHRPTVADADARLAERVRSAIAGGGTMPPSLKQLAEETGASPRKLAEIIGVLAERGEVVKVSSDLVFSRRVVEQVEQRLRAALAERGQITAAEFRDLIGATRKYSIPLLDYFDRAGVTIRQGDYRRLRG